MDYLNIVLFWTKEPNWEKRVCINILASSLKCPMIHDDDPCLFADMIKPFWILSTIQSAVYRKARQAALSAKELSGIFFCSIIRGPTHITQTDVWVSRGDTLSLFKRRGDLIVVIGVGRRFKSRVSEWWSHLETSLPCKSKIGFTELVSNERIKMDTKSFESSLTYP